VHKGLQQDSMVLIAFFCFYLHYNIFLVHVNIRRALPADFDSSWYLTQDPDFRRASGVNVTESKELHFIWYATVLSDPNAILLIAESDDYIVGQVLIRAKGKEGTMAVVTAPNQRGKGFGTSMIMMGCSYARAELQISRIKARIANNVKGAIGAFMRSGFLVIEQGKNAPESFTIVAKNI